MPARSPRQTALAELVASYRTSAPKLAAWLEENAHEGRAVFALPEHHHRRLRTSNPMEHSVQQELPYREGQVFPTGYAPATDRTVLVEVDEKWTGALRQDWSDISRDRHLLVANESSLFIEYC